MTKPSCPSEGVTPSWSVLGRPVSSESRTGSPSICTSRPHPAEMPRFSPQIQRSCTFRPETKSSNNNIGQPTIQQSTTGFQELLWRPPVQNPRIRGTIAPSVSIRSPWYHPFHGSFKKDVLQRQAGNVELRRHSRSPAFNGVGKSCLSLFDHHRVRRGALLPRCSCKSGVLSHGSADPAGTWTQS